MQTPGNYTRPLPKGRTLKATTMRTATGSATEVRVDDIVVTADGSFEPDPPEADETTSFKP